MQVIKKIGLISLALSLAAGCSSSNKAQPSANNATFDREVDYLVLGGGAAFYSGGILGGVDT